MQFLETMMTNRYPYSASILLRICSQVKNYDDKSISTFSLYTFEDMFPGVHLDHFRRSKHHRAENTEACSAGCCWTCKPTTLLLTVASVSVHKYLWPFSAV